MFSTHYRISIEILVPMVSPRRVSFEGPSLSDEWRVTLKSLADQRVGNRFPLSMAIGGCVCLIKQCSCIKNLWRTVRRTIRTILLSLFYLTSASISIADTDECLQLKIEYDRAHNTLRNTVLKWEITTNTENLYIIPPKSRTKDCEKLQKDFNDIMAKNNEFADQLRSYKEKKYKADQAELDKIQTQIVGQEEKDKKTLSSARDSFAKRMKHVNNFLSENNQNSQSPQEKLKTALDHLSALRDLTTKKMNFPEPWDIPDTRLPMPTLGQPIGGACTCR